MFLLLGTSIAFPLSTRAFSVLAHSFQNLTTAALLGSILQLMALPSESPANATDDSRKRHSCVFKTQMDVFRQHEFPRAELHFFKISKMAPTPKSILITHTELFGENVNVRDAFLLTHGAPRDGSDPALHLHQRRRIINFSRHRTLLFFLANNEIGIICW
jgi:hypothetical protein